MFHLYNLVCDRRNLIITSPRGRSNPATPTRLYRGRDGKTTPTRLYQAREGIFIKRCSSGNEGRINTRRIWTRSGRRWNLWIKEYLEYNPGRYKQILKNESSADCGAAQSPSKLCSNTTCLKASTKRILKKLYTVHTSYRSQMISKKISTILHSYDSTTCLTRHSF